MQTTLSPIATVNSRGVVAGISVAARSVLIYIL